MGELKDGVLYTFDESTRHWVEADEVVPDAEYRFRSGANDLAGDIIPCPTGSMVSGSLLRSSVWTKTFGSVRFATFEDAKAALLAWLQRGEVPVGDAEPKPEAPKPEPPPADEVATLRAEVERLKTERDAALAKVEEIRAEAKDRAYWEQHGGDVLRAEIVRLTAERDEARVLAKDAHNAAWQAVYVEPSKDRAEVERLRVDLAQAREEVADLKLRATRHERDKQAYDDHVLGLCSAHSAVEGVLKRCLAAALSEVRHATQEKTLAQTRMAREAGEEVDA